MISLSKKLRSSWYRAKSLKAVEVDAISKIDHRSPVVTLSSVPARIDSIGPTVYSLLKQKLKPKKIVINLGKDFFVDKKVPEFLLDLDIIRINFVEKDTGPATKFLPTICSEPKDQVIVVVDDDMFYSDGLLDGLVSASELDESSAFCVNGCRIKSNYLNAQCIICDTSIQMNPITNKSKYLNQIFTTHIFNDS